MREICRKVLHSTQGSGKASWGYLSQTLKDERIRTEGTEYAMAEGGSWGNNRYFVLMKY